MFRLNDWCFIYQEMIAVPGVTDVLNRHAWVYKSDEKNEIHALTRAVKRTGM